MLAWNPRHLIPNTGIEGAKPLAFWSMSEGDGNSVKRKSERQPVWVWALGAAVAAAPSMGVVVWRAYAWQCATDWRALRWVLLLVGVLALAAVLLGPTLLSARKEAGEHLPQAGRRAIWSIGAVLALGMIGQGLATNLASSYVYDYAKSAEPSVGEFYRNHDSTRLAGRTVRMVVLRVRDGIGDDTQKRGLAEVANILPEAWVEFATGPNRGTFALLTGGTGEGGVDEPQLAAFLADRNREALSPQHWGELLDSLCDERGVAHLSGAARNEACKRLTDTFAYSLREAFKHAWMAGDKAWAGLMLDAVTQSLDSARRGADERDAIWRIELTKLGEDFAALRRLESSLSEAQARRHVDVLARFDRLESKVDQVLAEVRGLRDDFDELAGSLAAAGVGGGATLPTITPELRGSLERLLDSGDPIDRAMAAIASVERPYGDSTWTAADEQLRVADVWRASGVNWTLNDEFRYRMALGNRRFTDDDPGGAQPEFEAALQLQPGNVAATVMLSRALAQARGGSAYADLVRARGLLESVIGQLSKLDDAWQSIVLGNLGCTLRTLEELDLAQEYLQRALEFDETREPLDELAIARDCSNLAQVLRALGQPQAARALAERALDLQVAHVGPNDASAATFYSNLGTILFDLGELGRALESLRQAVAIDEASLPPVHPVLGRDYSNLAQVLKGLGKLEEAFALMERAIANDEACFAPTHPTLAIRYSNFAALLQDLRELERARQYIERAISIDEANLPPHHPLLAVRYSNLALILQDSGLPDLALDFMRRATKIDEAAYGIAHPAVARDYSNLSIMFEHSGDVQGALEYIRQAISIEEAAYGSKHVTLGTSRSNLAMFLRATDNLAEAKVEMERAIAVKEATLPPNHPALATGYANLAAILQDLDEYSEARVMLERAIAIDEANWGPDHPWIEPKYSGLATVLERLGEFDTARDQLNRVIAISELALGSEHPDVATARAHLASILTGLGDLDGARQQIEWSISILQHYPHLVDVEFITREWHFEFARRQGKILEASQILEANLGRARQTLEPGDERIERYAVQLTGLRAEINAASDDPPDPNP